MKKLFCMNICSKQNKKLIFNPISQRVFKNLRKKIRPKIENFKERNRKQPEFQFIPVLHLRRKKLRKIAIKNHKINSNDSLPTDVTHRIFEFRLDLNAIKQWFACCLAWSWWKNRERTQPYSSHRKMILMERACTVFTCYGIHICRFWSVGVCWLFA